MKPINQTNASGRSVSATSGSKGTGYDHQRGAPTGNQSPQQGFNNKQSQRSANSGGQPSSHSSFADRTPQSWNRGDKNSSK